MLTFNSLTPETVEVTVLNQPENSSVLAVSSNTDVCTISFTDNILTVQPVGDGYASIEISLIDNDTREIIADTFILAIVVQYKPEIAPVWAEHHYNGDENACPYMRYTDGEYTMGMSFDFVDDELTVIPTANFQTPPTLKIYDNNNNLVTSLEAKAMSTTGFGVSLTTWNSIKSYFANVEPETIVNYKIEINVNYNNKDYVFESNFNAYDYRA